MSKPAALYSQLMNGNLILTNIFHRLADSVLADQGRITEARHRRVSAGCVNFFLGKID